MVTRDNGAGLLSRAARLLGRPSGDGSQADPDETGFGSDPGLAAGAAKELLKQTVERKRKYDLVRRREFDQLRKIRRNHHPGAGARLRQAPDFRPSISANLNERAMTLRKIDEIEAQMSKQWWNNKTAPLQPTDPLPAPSGAGQAPTRALASATGNPASTNLLAFAATVQSSPNLSGPQDSEYALTQAGWLDSQDGAAGTGQVQDSVNAGWQRRALHESETVPALAATSTSTADAELETAAILFANGDDTAVAANLLAGWQACALDVERSVAWAAALFDFYRSTARPADFERLALDYGQRLQRPAPGWLPTSVPVRAQTQDVIWHCPAQLDWLRAQALMDELSPIPVPTRFQLVGELRGNQQALLQQWQVVPAVSQVLLIDCTRLVRVDFAAAGSILNWLAARRSEPGRVRFCEVGVLLAIFFQLVGIGDDAQIQLRQA